MTQPVDTIYVEIRVDDDTVDKDFKNAASKATKSFQKEVNNNLKNVEKDINGVLNNLATGFGRSPLVKFLSGAGNFGAGLGVFATGIAGVAATAGQAIGALAAFAVELENAAGAALIIPGALATAAAVIATFAVGISGVGDALKESVKAQDSAGQSAVDYARQVKNAQQALVSANQRVADSERDLAKATEAVNKARQTAAEQIAELSEDIDDARLDERQSVLDLADAEQDLAKTREDFALGKATAEDVARAELAYDRAADSLSDVRKRIKELSKDQADANRKGVEGSDVVQSALERQQQAQRNLASSQQAAVDAAENLAAAQQKTGAATQKAADAMAKLAPAGRELVETLLGLKSAYEGFQQAVQQTLLTGVADELRRTATQVLPVVQAGFVGIAQVLNRQVIVAFQALRSESVKLDLASIFTSARGTLDNFTPAIQPLIIALTDVAEVGARVLTEITQGAGQAIADFAQYVSDLASSGELEQIMRDGLEVMKQFGLAALDVLQIITGILRAAESINGVNLFNILDRLNQFVNSPAGQGILVSVFESLNQVFEALFPVVEAVAGQLPALAEAIKVIALAFGPALVTVVEALGPALASLGAPIASLAPALASLSTLFQPLAVIFGDFITAIGPGLQAVIVALGEGLANLAPAAGPLGEAFSAILGAIAPLLPLAGQLLANILIPLSYALQALAATLAPVISLFAQGLTEALQTLLPIIAQAAQTFLPMFVQLGQDLALAFLPLIPVFFQVGQVLIQALIATMPILLTAFQQLLPLIVQVANVFAQQLAAALTALMPYIPQLVEGFIQFTAALIQFSGQLLQAILPYLPQLVGLFIEMLPILIPIATSLFPLLAQILASVGDMLPSLVEAWFQLVVAVTELFKIVGPFIPEILRLTTAMLQWATESGALDLILQAVLLTLNAIPMIVSVVIQGIKILVSVIGAAAFQAGQFARVVGETLSNGLRSVGDTLSRLPSYFANFGSLLVNAGKNLITGLINGIGSMIPQLFGYVKDIGSSIVDFFNSALGNASPSKLAAKAGANFLKGADVGLERELPAVKRTISQVSEVIAGAVPTAGHAESRAMVQQQMGPVTVVAQFGTERFTALATTASFDAQRATARKVLAKPRSV